MAASVRINRHTGVAGATLSNLTADLNTVVNLTDTHQINAPGSTNPIPIPTAGVNRSFWCVTRLQATTAPTGTINNIRWFTNGTNNWGTGVTCFGNAATGYTQATAASASSGTQLIVGNYATLVSAPVNVNSATSGSPISIAGSTTTAAQFGNYFVYQFEIGTTAIPGATTAQTFTWAYDET